MFTKLTLIGDLIGTSIILIYAIYMLCFIIRIMKTPTVRFIPKYIWVKKPRRATEGSAGFDFYTPTSICIPPKTTQVIDTYITAIIPKNFVMMLYPRSSLGIKHKLILANSVSIIDCDYRDTIKIPLYNYGDKPITLNAHERVVQGVVTPYITDGKKVTTKRNGGIGSTGRR